LLDRREDQPTMAENTYSADWSSIFMDTIAPEQTEREVAFVDAFLRRGSRVLDIPCGTGRHARGLAARGHHVIAVDRDPRLLAPAPGDHAPVCADMKHIPLRPSSVDAVICLWQSFGHFSDDENASVLQAWFSLVEPGGMLILDLYDRSYFDGHQGERAFSRAGESIRETRRMAGNRLFVELVYEDRSGSDRFEWRLFTPDELCDLASSAGWRLSTACSGFNVNEPPDGQRPRVQYVFRA
jgi:SAM-dependent methyltransferase